MNNCRHEFFEIKPNDSEFPFNGIRVVCVYCGQVRMIWSNGEIEVIKEFGEIKTKHQDYEKLP